MTIVESDDEIIIRAEGTLGRITLNRPEALNAINHGMVKRIDAALESWRNDPSIAAILIDGAGEKAFCSGGDILHLYENGRENPEIGRPFWADEYRLNAKIAHYPKPYIAVMDGITMGGGVRLAVHGTHRIVTERSLVAMPEVGIGFLPDVGGTFILAGAPGETGLYLGMTGARMNAADAIFAGFADVYVPSNNIAELVQLLATGHNVDRAIAQFASQAFNVELAEKQQDISEAFSKNSALGCVLQLGEMAERGNEWAARAFKAISRASPTSVAATFYAVLNAADFDTLEECLAMEYRFAYRTLNMHDFYEGVRAVLVDRDRNPKWKPSRLQDVTEEMIDEVFGAIGEHEWHVA